MEYSRESLGALTVAQLKELAGSAGIDATGLKKADLVEALATHYEGGNEMSEELNQGQEFEETEGIEGADTTGEVNTEGPATEDKEVFHLADGSECSKSAFIREKFLKDNMSRKDISEQFNIPYRTVYGATVNMENDADPAGRGRKASSTTILVSEEGQVLTTKVEVQEDGTEIEHVYINEEVVEGAIASEAVEGVVTVALVDGTAIAFTETDRNTWVRAQVEAGVSRGDVAKALGISFGVVYGITKEQAGTRAKHMVEIEDPENPGQTKEISRNEYIRQLFAGGMKKSDIAKELGVEYSVVWAATKAEKTDDEKYQEAIEKLKKFEELIPEEDKEAFQAAVASLEGITIPEPAEEETEAEDNEPTVESTEEV